MRILLKKVLVWTVVLVVLIGLSVLGYHGLTHPQPQFSAATKPKIKLPAPIIPIVQGSAGVELRGCQGKDDGAWLRNANDYSVRVRGVKVHYIPETEVTMWMREVKPEEVLGIDLRGNGSSTLAFYIYSVDGGLLGFIPGYCPPSH